MAEGDGIGQICRWKRGCGGGGSGGGGSGGGGSGGEEAEGAGEVRFLSW